MPKISDDWWNVAFETFEKEKVWRCKCLIEIEAGEERKACGYDAKRNATNQKHHLSSAHGVNDKDHEVLKVLREKAAEVERKRDIRALIAATPVKLKSLAGFFARATACTGASNTFWSTPEVRELLEAIRAHQLLIETHRDTITAAVKDEAERELQAALELRRGLMATIAIDSGTVVHRYFFVCLLCPSFPAILVAAVPDDEMQDARLTAENLTAALREIIEKLKEYQITIVACCGDNAANMQAACRALSVDGVIGIRCMAHSLNLIYKRAIDETEESLFDAWRVALLVHSRNAKSPRLIETRWNYKYTWLQKVHDIIFTDRDGYDISFLTAADSAKVRDAVAVFDVICESITRLQADAATFLDVIVVLSNLHVAYAGSSATMNEKMRKEVYAAMVHHGTKLASDASMCLAFFHPGLDRSKYSPRVVEGVRNFVRLSGALLLRTTPSDMVASFTGAMTEAPVSDDNLARPMTISEIIAYWTLSPATLRLALMLQRLAALAPTEASVEREFSKLKIIVNDLRTSLLPENAVAPVILRSCCRSRREAQTIEDTVETKIDARQCHHTVALWTVANVREIPQPQAKATRQVTSTCNICGKPFNEHADDLNLKCYICGGHFSYLCAGINRQMISTDDPTGRCIECRRAKSHRTE
jgi:hypothetical protein